MLTNEQSNTRAKKYIVQKQKVRNIHELQTSCPCDKKKEFCTIDGTIASVHRQNSIRGTTDPGSTDRIEIERPIQTLR